MLDLSNASLLIVDDSETMRAILRDMARRLGFNSIDEAADGQAALAKIKMRAFTLILSDWHMSPMTGIELLREVRRISISNTNRFIMVTSESGWSGKTTAKVDGVDAYLIKPFKVDDLRTAIEKVLSRREGDSHRRPF